MSLKPSGAKAYVILLTEGQPLVIHDKGCYDAIVEVEFRRREVLRRWPKICPLCGGSGEQTWYENGAPMGEGNWPMPMWEPCACIEAERCPRCAERIYAEQDAPDYHCLACGWREGTKVEDTDLLWPLPECTCYHHDVDQAAVLERLRGEIK